MSSHFVLRVGERELALVPGELVLGRGEDCDFSIDDALVSRRHARIVVTESSVEIEDLDSRNGVLVDGTRIAARTAIAHGSVLGIGGLRLVLIDRGTRRDHATRPGESMLRLATARRAAPQAATFSGLSVVALVFQARDALDSPDVERLRESTKRLVPHLAPGALDDDALLGQAHVVFARCATELASRTGDASWIDAIFEVHARSARVLDRDAVHALVTAVADLGYRSPGPCAGYLRAIRERAGSLRPEEAAVLRRLDALLRVIAA